MLLERNFCAWEMKGIGPALASVGSYLLPGWAVSKRRCKKQPVLATHFYGSVKHTGPVASVIIQAGSSITLGINKMLLSYTNVFGLPMLLLTIKATSLSRRLHPTLN